MLKDIEKAVRDEAKNGAEKVRIELIKHRRFSGGFVKQYEAFFELTLVGDKPALLKSGKLSAMVVKVMADCVAKCNMFETSKIA